MTGFAQTTPNGLVQYGMKRRPTFPRMSCRERGEACLGARGYVSVWRRRSFEGPHLQVLDGEVLFGGQWQVIEGGALGGGAVVKVSVQPQAQTTPGKNDD